MSGQSRVERLLRELLSGRRDVTEPEQDADDTDPLAQLARTLRELRHRALRSLK